MTCRRRKNTCTLGAEPPYGQMRSRFLPELNNLQTTMGMSCISTKMLHIFAAAGHHQYTKGTWLELIKGLETLSAYKDTLERLLANVKNVVLYSSHECPVRGVTSALSRH